ncbi:MAG: outer membrane lipoprotein-sorting protein [Thermodesulfobacteriota bacterium]
MAEKIGLVDGLWVMKKVEDRYEGDDVKEDMYLTLDRTGKRAGKPRHLDVRWLKKDYGKEDKLVINFIGPDYVAGATLLMEIKPYVDDNRWLYIPDNNLIAEIKARDQHTNFMGTDFTYYDLAEREPDEENHKLLKIEELNNRLCYVVETKPKENVDDGYSKKISWVDKERFTKMRIKYYNKAGRFVKQFDPAKWEKIDGIWTARQLVMEDFSREHKTTIDRKNIRYNQKIAAEYFLPYNIDCIQYKGGKFSLLPFDQRPTRVRAEKRKKSSRRRKYLPPQKKE